MRSYFAGTFSFLTRYLWQSQAEYIQTTCWKEAMQLLLQTQDIRPQVFPKKVL